MRVATLIAAAFILSARAVRSAPFAVWSLVLATGLCSLCGGYTLAAGRDELLAEAHEKYVNDVDAIKSLLFDKLAPDDASVYRSVAFRVLPDDYEFGAGAYVLNGQRRVELCVGFFRALEMSIDAEVIEQAYGPRGFFARYANYVALRRAQNNDLRERGRDIQFIKSPYEFAGMSDNRIDAFDANQQLRRIRAGFYSQALSFVLAHELAHHVRGHQPPKRGETAAVRREHEQDADDWASSVLIEHQMFPTSGRFSLMMLAFVPDVSPETANLKDHPGEIARIEKMYFVTKQALPQMQSRLDALARREVEREFDRELESIKRQSLR